ncbi:MAG TPA: NAD(P)/FAD-dependent oxidoreductase [Cytophagaceae bacterium]
MKKFDAVVIGSGPNGLVAAIVMQQAGLSVLLLEAKPEIGGGLRTSEVTLPGFHHDICSAIHPMAAASPVLQLLPLSEFGLEYIYPDIAAAHPFDDGSAALLLKSLEKTSDLLGNDSSKYLDLIKPLVLDWNHITRDALGPLAIPSHPLAMAKFGLNALRSAQSIANEFTGKHAKGLWAGMAGHSIQPFTNIASSAIGLILLAAGHVRGWPIPKGGSQSIANALASYFKSLGGVIETNSPVNNLNQLPESKAILFDVTPRQLLQIAGEKFSSLYKWQLNRYKYGMGVFKIDWALSEPVPFKNADCKKAGTIHIGNTYEEIAEAEHQTSLGNHPEKPFVLLAQQSLFDSTRAPEGKQTLWGYCHVPNGSTKDRTEAIENQIERFAPGFKDVIIERKVKNTSDFQSYNPNYIGGDINGGVIDITQLFTRPALRLSPYRTSAKGIYICSSSTPPGGGVHGMCGYHAAKRALKDIFGLKAMAI